MNKQYTCEKCNFTTKYRSSLSRHNQSRKHLLQANVKPISKPKEVHNCESCEYSTAIKSNFTRHCKSKRHLGKILNHTEKTTNKPSPVTPPEEKTVMKPYECVPEVISTITQKTPISCKFNECVYQLRNRSIIRLNKSELEKEMERYLCKDIVKYVFMNYID